MALDLTVAVVAAKHLPKTDLMVRSTEMLTGSSKI